MTFREDVWALVARWEADNKGDEKIIGRGRSGGRVRKKQEGSDISSIYSEQRDVSLNHDRGTKNR